MSMLPSILKRFIFSLGIILNTLMVIILCYTYFCMWILYIPIGGLNYILFGQTYISKLIDIIYDRLSYFDLDDKHKPTFLSDLRMKLFN